MTDDMKAPERIWAWEGDEQDGWENAYATVAADISGSVEYVRRDPAVLAALPEVQAMLAAAYEVMRDFDEKAVKSAAKLESLKPFVDDFESGCLHAAARCWVEAAARMRNLTLSDATAALARIEAAAEARGMRKAAEDIAKWHLEEGWKLDVDDVPAAILARAEEIERAPALPVYPVTQADMGKYYDGGDSD